jgi:hypothetical protein
MTTRTTLRSATGAAIAVMEDEGSRVVIRSMTGAYKGYYDKKSDRTYKNTGSFYGIGNQLMMLL